MGWRRLVIKKIFTTNRSTKEGSYGGALFEFCAEIWRQKNRIVGLSDGEEIMMKEEIFLRFDTIPARDGRTDRHVAVAKTRSSIASRG